MSNFISKVQLTDNVVAEIKDANAQTSITNINGQIGTMSNLVTADKSSLVNAINSAVGNYNDIIGNIDNLSTSEKTSVVNAINSIINERGALSDLDTTDKTKIINAINEVLATGSSNNITTNNRIDNVILNLKLLNVATVYTDDLGDVFTTYESDYDGFIIPAGDYNMITSYSPTKTIIIIGYNSPTIHMTRGVGFNITNARTQIENITLDYPNQTEHITTTPNVAIRIDNCSYCVLKNITIYHSDAGIWLNNAPNTVVDDCFISHSLSEISAGYWIGGDSNDSIINNCTGSYCILDGFNCDSNGVTFNNCVAHHNGLEPLVGGSTALGSCGFYSTTDTYFSRYLNCKAFSNGESGFDLINFRFGIIENCHAYQNGLSGIALTNPTYSRISKNTCTDNGKNSTTLNPTSWGHSGIDFRNGTGRVIVNENICADTQTTHTQQYGIALLSGDPWFTIVTDNILRDNKTDSIYGITDGTDYSIVKSNVVN